ncbi:MAG: NADH-quinone oxidoreductase subunit C, partial [Anaerolineales bacterium]
MSVVEKAVAVLKENLGNDVLDVVIFRDQTSVVLERSMIVQACELLRDSASLQFNFLAALTAVDYWPDEPRFKIVYQLYSLPNKVFVGLNVPVPGEDPTIDTVESIFPNANWHERELFDMFGIAIKGHSDLRRIIMPHDWQGHP